MADRRFLRREAKGRWLIVMARQLLNGMLASSLVGARLARDEDTANIRCIASSLIAGKPRSHRVRVHLGTRYQLRLNPRLTLFHRLAIHHHCQPRQLIDAHGLGLGQNIEHAGYVVEVEYAADGGIGQVASNDQ